MTLRTLKLTLALATAAPAVSAQPVAPDFELVLSAIAEVETGSDNSKRGRASERSMYQITPAVWRSHTAQPFQLATEDAALARRVALAHLQRLARQLAWREYQPSAYNLALVWNGGLGALKKPRASTRDYAQRVENLVKAQRKS